MHQGVFEWQRYRRSKWEQSCQRNLARIARKDAECKALRSQENCCAICKKFLHTGSFFSYITHRICPGRVGGKYEPGNVLLVCSAACHVKAEEESRRAFPVIVIPK